MEKHLYLMGGMGLVNPLRIDVQIYKDKKDFARDILGAS
jgi:hypothetical protein